VIGFGEKRLNSATKKIATAIGVSLFFASSAGATTLYCGSKTVTLSGNTVVKIIHEDGTVHDGASTSKWWSYDGKAIMHSRLQERLLCSTKAKSRNEIIEELSGQFSKNPKNSWDDCARSQTHGAINHNAHEAREFLPPVG
jgi:hypothetical protein